MKKELGYCCTEEAIKYGLRTKAEIGHNSCSISCDQCKCFGHNGVMGDKAHQSYSSQFAK